jgi:hypothetical protein
MDWSHTPLDAGIFGGLGAVVRYGKHEGERLKVRDTLQWRGSIEKDWMSGLGDCAYLAGFALKMLTAISPKSEGKNLTENKRDSSAHCDRPGRSRTRMANLAIW